MKTLLGALGALLACSLLLNAAMFNGYVNVKPSHDWFMDGVEGK